MHRTYEMQPFSLHRDVKIIQIGSLAGPFIFIISSFSFKGGNAITITWFCQFLIYVKEQRLG